MPPPAADEADESRTSSSRAFPAAFLSLCFLFVMLAVLGPSCSGDETSLDSGVTFEDAAPSVDAGAADASRPDVPPITVRDAEIIVFHDAGAPEPCAESCDCPQGLGCVGGTCRVLGALVYCCSKPGCPAGQPCLAENDRPQTCALPDGGPPPASCERPDAAAPTGADGGLGSIGAACASDFECNTALGYTCWEPYEPPFVWGYCTLENCTGGCPPGSMCIQFNIPPPNGPVLGCMQTCNADSDCRTDAYCFFIAGGGFSICFPNCRDDLFECGPRDGTLYCDHITGQCEPNMCHAEGGTGDPCIDNQDCKEGHVCMTEAGWGFSGGMCTRVCTPPSGQTLPEAQPCENEGTGETCQEYAGIGLCFRDCENGACPHRPNAVCGTLDPVWSTPGCLAF